MLMMMKTGLGFVRFVVIVIVDVMFVLTKLKEIACIMYAARNANKL